MPILTVHITVLTFLEAVIWSLDSDLDLAEWGTENKITNLVLVQISIRCSSTCRHLLLLRLLLSLLRLPIGPTDYSFRFRCFIDLVINRFSI